MGYLNLTLRQWKHRVYFLFEMYHIYVKQKSIKTLLSEVCENSIHYMALWHRHTLHFLRNNFLPLNKLPINETECQRSFGEKDACLCRQIIVIDDDVATADAMNLCILGLITFTYYAINSYRTTLNHLCNIVWNNNCIVNSRRVK